MIEVAETDALLKYEWKNGVRSNVTMILSPRTTWRYTTKDPLFQAPVLRVKVMFAGCQGGIGSVTHIVIEAPFIHVPSPRTGLMEGTR